MFATIKDFLVNLASSGPQRAHIDLLLAQLSAAEKKIVDTDRRLSDALIKAGLLETELEELRSQLPNQTPVPEISSNTVSVIKAIYSFRGRADSTSISRTTGIPPEDVEYHFGVHCLGSFMAVRCA